MLCNLVFDWAGTLLDDGALAWSATNAVLCEFGADAVSRTQFDAECLAPVASFYAARIPHVSQGSIEQVFCEAYAGGVADAPLRDGAKEVLLESHVAGAKLFICSTLPEAIIRETLAARGMDHLFLSIAGSASEKAAPLAVLLEKYKLKADETLMCGDSPHDIEAGRECGVATAALLGGQASEEALRGVSPDQIFRSHRELLEFLRLDRARSTNQLVIPTVGGFIVDASTGRLLLVRTRKWSGLWGLPGGKIDVGETMEAAWHREAREEVGLELEATRFLMIQDSVFSKEFMAPRHFLLINYVSVARDISQLVLNHEITESLWVGVEDALSMDLNEPTRTALEFAQRQQMLEVG